MNYPSSPKLISLLNSWEIIHYLIAKDPCAHSRQSFLYPKYSYYELESLITNGILHLLPKFGTYNLEEVSVSFQDLCSSCNGVEVAVAHRHENISFCDILFFSETIIIQAFKTKLHERSEPVCSQNILLHKYFSHL